MIYVKNLFFDYERSKNYAVKNVSFHIDEGQIFGLLGPSGAGKTTIQNLMTAILPLQAGDIAYQNTSIRNLSRPFFNLIGYSFEHPNIYSKLTGLENLKYYAMFFSVSTENPYKLLEIAGLKSHADKPAGNYSKGMKQRLVFARALLNKPKILFLDEPLAGLDPSTASIIKDIIRQKQREGTTILLTTHDMYAADELCDTVAFINKGEIVEIDSPINLKLKFGSRSIRVDYAIDKGLQSSVYFYSNMEDRSALKRVIEDGNFSAMHSQEATLEDIFKKITGSSLN